VTKLKDVNTTDIRGAIELGCHTMCHTANADDADIPFGAVQVRPQSEARFRPGHEAHHPGRYLNALLNAEDAAGIEIGADCIDKHTRAAYFSYSKVPLPLERIGEHVGGKGTPIELGDHSVREGFHALYALTKYRDSDRARELAEASIQIIFDYWVPNEEWDFHRIERDLPVKIERIENTHTFIQRMARSIGPLVKFYRATGHRPALQLAEVLKDKAIRDFYPEDGSFSTAILGNHAHSITSVLSSLAQFADLTRDDSLIARVKTFYDNGLWEMRDQIGWSVEVTFMEGNYPLRGEANNTGDIIETALILGQWGYAGYYADAERMLRSHLLPSQLRDISFIAVADNADGADAIRNFADRIRGAFGFPAQYGHEPAGIWESDNPRIGFHLDIVGGVVGSLCEAYRSVTRFDETGHWVNMLFDHETTDIEVRSPYTHPRLEVKIKKLGSLHLRIPPWVDRDLINVTGLSGAADFSEDYLILKQPEVGQWIALDFDLPEHETVLTFRDTETRARFRGDEVVAMDNFGTDLTFFEPFE
jgi:hypothetical protein